MLKRLLLLLVAITLATGISADEALKREMRAAWIATVWQIDWPSSSGANAQKAQIDNYLDNFKAQNFNAVFFQVRSMCDAMYQSSYEPWSSYLTGTRGRNPGYDPLAYVVEQCHARGIQCHAWVNPYRFSTGSDWNTTQDQELKNSGMLLTYSTSSATTIILNPGLPETRQRIVNVVREIITNYDVDGIVFDDYFYPNGIPTNRNAEDYDLWNNSAVDMTFADWRRNNVNMMVRDVYNMIQEVKPEVRFGISPAGVAGTANTSAGQHGVTPCPRGSDWQYNGIFSDPLAWLEQGTVDYISPQIYWWTTSSSNPFGPITDWWSYIAKHFGRHHYASHSISFFDDSNTTSDWAEVVQQINLSRLYTEDNCPGAVLYSTRYINGPRKTGLGDYLLANAFQRPAMIPAVTWKETPNYGAPDNLSKFGDELTWTSQHGTLVKYSVYAVPVNVTIEQAMSSKYDGIKGDYLLGITYTPSYSLPSGYQNGYWYAVCIVDGYGNESEPAYLGVNPDIKVTETPVITSEITDDAVIITATGNGTVKLYIDDTAVSNPYTITRGNSNVTVTATATAQEDGKLESEPAVAQILVPAREGTTEITYSIEKVWEINNLSFLTTGDARQGFGMDGKFYINDKGTSTILVVDQNGLTGETYEGGRNAGFTRDEAGNLVVGCAQFPYPWSNSNTNIKVINPATGEVATYTLPSDVTNFDRSDLLGFARGNLLENGEFYIVGATSGSTISRITITDGELDLGNTYLASCNGVSASTGTVLNAYKDAAGNEAVLYVNRSSSVVKMLPNGNNFVGTSISLPNKGNSNGTFPFVWGGKDYMLYPTINNYRDGFAVAEPNAAEPLVYVPQTASSDANSFQANWLNAEVIDLRYVNIYQYYPGGHITLWRLTKNGVNMRGDVNQDGTISIADVTSLIGYILGGKSTGIDLDNCDCNYDTFIDIADVTVLISRVLSGHWSNSL